MDLQYTVFEYLYRDSINGKTTGQLLLEGTAFPEDVEALEDLLENRSLFFAEVVGVPPLCGEIWIFMSSPACVPRRLMRFWSSPCLVTLIA